MVDYDLSNYFCEANIPPNYGEYPTYYDLVMTNAINRDDLGVEEQRFATLDTAGSVPICVPQDVLESTEEFKTGQLIVSTIKNF